MAQKLAERLGQAVIVYAKANPNLANYASSSATFQLATELFKMRTGAPLEHIPYKCSGKMLAAVIGSEVLMALERGRIAPIDLGAPRKPCHRHGPWRPSGNRATAGRDGACQCRHREYHQPACQRGPRSRAAAADGRTLSHHGDRRVRGAQSPDPLGAGDVRSGWHGARIREVGL